jgi:hypothetical protein
LLATHGLHNHDDRPDNSRLPEGANEGVDARAKLVRFEVLKGLPPYGPIALPFPEAWAGHSEGLVIRFEPDAGEAWVGNFRRGSKGCEGALLHPNGREVVVVSRGQFFVVDPESHLLVAMGAPDIQDLIALPDLSAIVISDGIQFEAINPTGSWWRSPRISWDGLRNVRREGMALRGEAFTPLAPNDGAWFPFSLDLTTGRCADAIYERQMRGASRLVPRGEG